MRMFYNQKSKEQKVPSFPWFKLIALISIFFLLFLVGTFIRLRLDCIWFDVIGYVSVFWTIFKTKIFVSVLLFLTSFLFSYLNLFLVFRLTKKVQRNNIIFLIAFLLSLMIMGGSSQSWLYILQYFHAIPFELSDPQFHLDIGFYVFKLPLLWLGYQLVNAWLLLNLIVTILSYVILLPRGVEIISKNIKSRIFSGVEKKGLLHSGVLLGLFIMWQTVQYKLASYELLYSQLGSVIGAGAADIGARLPVYYLMMGLSVVVGIWIIFTSSKNIRHPLFILGGYILIVILATGIYPRMYQKFIIDPDELTQEKPYLERNIHYTRLAYGIENLTEVEYPVGELTPKKIAENRSILDNIRLLDPRATISTYDQQQEIRYYYDFVDVDVDRYLINGKLTQVLLSARELNRKSFSEQANTFNNLMFIYTHGFGLVMSPANKVTEAGLPEYLIQDIPPKSDDFKINQPRIYFGEATEDNVIVNTALKEFDYPVGDKNEEYVYQGTKGIPLSFFNKLMLSIRDRQIKYLLSNYITPESQYLETRNVRDRVSRIAPFLMYDRDPYLVLGEDGKLYYLQDAYTYTDKYPYSEALEHRGFNYLRNSVKVVVDAYTGEVNFYIFDPKDPIIQTYRNIFPGLFKEKEDFPQDLLVHIRYPEDLFTVQSLILQDYHMKNPTVFYNREDRWELSQETYSGQKIVQDPYYSIIRIPGNNTEEFVLMRMFTPVGKQNSIAWLAGRSDGEHYGKLLLYKFPKGIPGTIQVESLIDQDPNISSQLTLWGQGGSRTLRGNLLVYPIGGALLYVEPLYIEAEQNKYPQLKKVFVFYKDRIIMEDTLQKALKQAFDNNSKTTPQPILPTISENNINSLITRLIELHQQSKEKLREGDWANYGQIQTEMDEIIKMLEDMNQESE